MLIVDTRPVRDTLKSLWEQMLATPSIRKNLPELQVAHLQRIIDPLEYPGQFWFPSTCALYYQVLDNFEIYLNEAISYVRYFRNIPNHGTRVQCIQNFMRQIWGKLKPRLQVPENQGSAIQQLIESNL
jgi:hypothetical protein